MTIDQSAVASTFGLGTEYQDLRDGQAAYLPQRILVVAQGASASSYPLEKWTSTGAAAAGARFGYGSPIHLALRALQPAEGGGVGTIPIDVIPLEDDYEAVAASGRITPAGTQTKAAQVRVLVNKIPSTWFVVATDDTVAEICDKIVAAVNGVLEMPAIATDVTTRVDFTAKWAGASGNDIYLEVEAEALGVTYTIVQPTGGLVNPDVTEPLELAGQEWYTLGLNGLNIADTDALDAYQTFGEARWDDLVHHPIVFFTGNTIADPTAATAVSAVRRDDRVNGQLPLPGSHNLPIVVAARELAKIAVVANNNPAKSYQKQKPAGLTPGSDEQAWDYPTRDFVVKRGGSTVTVEGGVVKISDVCTFYRPIGEEPPAYRYLVTIVKLQNSSYNFDLEFNKEEWASAPVVADSDVTVNPDAKQPKTWKAKANQILEALGKQAILAKVKDAKKKTTAVINSGNPNRIDLTVEFPVSSNGNITAIKQKFGFLFDGS